MKKLLISTLALFSVLAVSAQSDLTEVYSKAIEAYNAKDYATAVPGLETVIEQGATSDDPDVLGYVSTAKQILPYIYYMMGGATVQQKDYDTAVTYFARSAELAELYGNPDQAAKSKAWVANVYRAQGGTAYNAKDYATAIEVYSKGYAADPHNMEIALNLAASHAELAMAQLEVGQFLRGMEVYREVAALDNAKFAEAIEAAIQQITLYTNNMIAKVQGTGDNASLIGLTDGLLAADAQNALAHKVRVQTLYAMKDYQGVISAAPAAVAAQTTDADRSEVYYALGAAYSALSQAPQAVDAFRKVVAGPNVAVAKQAVEQLSKANG